MSSDLQGGRRLEAAIRLRDAGVALLQRKGKRSQVRQGTIVFEPHTPENPEPRLSLSLKHPSEGCFTLDVWAMRKDKHAKVLNISWLGDKVELASFLRGQWETELLAMGRAAAVH